MFNPFNWFRRKKVVVVEESTITKPVGAGHQLKTPQEFFDEIPPATRNYRRISNPNRYRVPKSASNPMTPLRRTDDDYYPHHAAHISAIHHDYGGSHHHSSSDNCSSSDNSSSSSGSDSGSSGGGCSSD